MQCSAAWLCSCIQLCIPVAMDHLPSPGRQSCDWVSAAQVCGTTAVDLETYKQHIRTKPHVRRLHNTSNNNSRASGP